MSIWHVTAALTCIYYPANRNVAGRSSSNKYVPSWPIFKCPDPVDIFSFYLFYFSTLFSQNVAKSKVQNRFLVFVVAVWFDSGADVVVSMQAVAMRFSELSSSKTTKITCAIGAINLPQFRVPQLEMTLEAEPNSEFQT